MLPRTRALVFTDRVQNTGPIPATTVVFSNLIPVAARLSGWMGIGETGAMYDHDGDGAPAGSMSGTPPIPVMVACTQPSSADRTCSATEIDDTGYVSSISGFRISTAPAGAPVAAVDERRNNKYLSFGVWLTEPTGTVNATNPFTFGAFANGGTPVTADTGGTPAGMKGTATYRGSAAGLHSTPTAIEFFSANATLTANFDPKDARRRW